MTKRELARESLQRITQYRRTVSPKVRFSQMVAEGTINAEGEVLVTKEERAAGRPLEKGSLNGPGTK